MWDRILDIAKRLPGPIASAAVIVVELPAVLGRAGTSCLLAGALIGFVASGFLLWRGYYPLSGKLYFAKEDQINAQQQIDVKEAEIADLKVRMHQGATSGVSGLTPTGPRGETIIDSKGSVTFSWDDPNKDESDYTIVVHQQLGNNDQPSIVKEIHSDKKKGAREWMTNFLDEGLPFGEYVWTVTTPQSDAHNLVYRVFSVYPSGLDKIRSLHMLTVGASLNEDITFVRADPTTKKTTGYEPTLVDLLKQELQRRTAGEIDVKYANVGWDDLLPRLRDHELDLVVSSMTKTKAREESKNVVFTDGYFTSHQRFVVPQGSVGCLAGKTIGVVGAQGQPTTNQMAAELLRSKYKFADVRVFDSSGKLLNALRDGEIKVALADEIQIERFFGENELFEFLGPELDETLKSVGFYQIKIGYPKEEFAMVITPQSKDLLPIINAVIAKARQDGTLDKLNGQLAPGKLKRVSHTKLC